MKAARRVFVSTVLILSSALSLLISQASQVDSRKENPSTCRVPELRAAQFLIGEWQTVVVEPTDKAADWVEKQGHSSWATLADGCVFLERRNSWLRGKQVEEIRLLAYDRRNEKWGLAVVDSEHGNLITVDGRATETGFVFTTRVTRRGRLLIDRETVARTSDGSFSWKTETSIDLGTTWHTLNVTRFVKPSSSKSH